MASTPVLTQEFFERDTVTVARELMGQKLCRRLSTGEILRWELCEVEAYDGGQDLACHACRGKTPRNAVMFGSAGVFYVYLCYGVHWLLNIVTGPADFPAAVLIRGAGPKIGPGRLTKAMQIDQSLNGLPATQESGLWVEQGSVLQESQIERTPRIGIGYAGEPWLSAPYRFVRKL
ncbi:DNA-3-methyladenine glycosylase [Cerasicoccus frondis]|uniref:DNA-3-methyladenine glycosylase n=1 Tax=Cerasicoccus frondis TaxID=490090 RepID=UPI002852A6CC|nr:DNA-3-methyladenine glycosylase [Cerasicoccus frondis]